MNVVVGILFAGLVFCTIMALRAEHRRQDLEYQVSELNLRLFATLNENHVLRSHTKDLVAEIEQLKNPPGPTHGLLKYRKNEHE